MFYKKEKKIRNLESINKIYLQEIEKRNKTVCPKCIYSTNRLERQKYRFFNQTREYLELVPVCKSNNCIGFEPKKIGSEESNPMCGQAKDASLSEVSPDLATGLRHGQEVVSAK